MSIENSKLFIIFENSLKTTNKVLGHTNEAMFPIEAKDFISGKGFGKDQLRGAVDLFVLAPLAPFLAVAGTINKLGELSIKAFDEMHSNKKTDNDKESETDLIITLLASYTKDCLIDLIRIMKLNSIKNITRLEAERRLVIHFLSINNIEYSIEFLTNFKKEYEKEIRKKLKTVDKKKKEIEKKKEFLLNNLHLTNSEQEKALKTPYHQLHKIKKEYNIPLFSEIKDEIQKANAIAYKNSKEFEKKIETMKKLDIRIPKRNVYEFATNTEIENLKPNKIYSFSKDVWSVEEYEYYYSLLNDFKLFKSDLKPVRDRNDKWKSHQKTLEEQAREEKRLIKQKARQEKIRELNKLSKDKSSAPLPKNHNKKWTDSDDIKLLEMVNSKKSIDKIAKQFLRTENSIILRCINVHKVRYKKLEYLIDDESKPNVQSYYKKYQKELLPPSLKN